MTLAAGHSLSFYEILGQLGAGAMGEVYRARDTRLEREVALKVLPPDFARDPERMARFEREAKVLASLQHPNIVMVHSVEHVGDLHFLTMELVEGETLASLIERKGMSLERFYPLASAIAEAVHAAHRKGITHRDLKPENVIIDASGRPKVLDFGLAKLEEPAPAGGGPSSLTGEGRAMGTIPYMAPEALRAADVDSRSDVFSLGVVFYELVTGAHPFPADDPGARISAILRDTPALASTVSGRISSGLARLLRRCLEKDPDERLQTALDLRNELRELATGAHVEGESVEPPRRRGLVVALMLGIVAVVVLFVEVAKRLRPGETATSYIAQPLTATSGLIAGPNWSPKGEFLAFARHVSGSLDLFVKPVVGGEAVLRLEGPGDESLPRWSPDGKTLAYLSTLEEGSPIHLAPPHSGHPRRLIDTNIPALEVKEVPDVLGDRPWSADGSSLLISRVTDTGQLVVFRVDANDGTAKQLTYPPEGRHDGAASYSFDGQRVVFMRRGFNRADLWTMSPTGADQAPLLVDGHVNETPAWRPDGRHVVFASGRGGVGEGLWEIDVTTGALEQLAFETKGIMGISISSENQLAYTSFWHDTFLFAVDVETGETRQLTDHPADNYSARFSPDGKTIAYSSTRDGDGEIWLHHLDGSPEQQITFDPGSDLCVDWSPDGKQLAFIAERDGSPALYLSNADGGNQTPIMEIRGLGLVAEDVGLRWAPDGELIGYVVSEPQGNVVWSILPDGTDARPLIQGVEDFDWYLDSRRIVYTSSRGRADELYAHHLDTGETKLIWQGKHAELEVAPDGRSIAICHGEGHQGMSLERLHVEPPLSRDGLPTVPDEEPEILVQARDRWHVHMGGWSYDSKRIVYTRDEDYSDIYELVEQR